VKENTFLIAVPHLGELRAETVIWMLDIGMSNSKNVTFLFRQEQPVSVSRNHLVKSFLDTENEWLLFLDSDMHPNDNILNMAKRGKLVVSAMTTCMSKGIPYPLIMKRHDVDGLVYHMITKPDLDKAVDGLIEVDGVGTGCLLIHRSVLENMKPPWFEFSTTEDGRLLQGEDYYFSKKCFDAGIKMFVDTTHQVGHMKTIDLGAFNRLLVDIIYGKATDITVINGGKSYEEKSALSKVIT